MSLKKDSKVKCVRVYHDWITYGTQKYSHCNTGLSNKELVC